jgi:catechol 2,3-dioxygenase-like lactoylglutathione lyase family enzyme
MTTGLGAPPKTGWAKLVPELLVSDIVASLEFWRDRLGFAIAYQRPEPAFAYLERPEGAQIMLCQRSGNWETAPLEPPYGRGAMFQVYVASIALPEGRSKLPTSTTSDSVLVMRPAMERSAREWLYCRGRPGCDIDWPPA